MGQRFNRLGVSKKQKQKRKQLIPATSNNSSVAKNQEEIIVSEKKIIIKTGEKPAVLKKEASSFDFFGFSPTAFYLDFKKTLFSAIAILLILLIIFFVIK